MFNLAPLRAGAKSLNKNMKRIVFKQFLSILVLSLIFAGNVEAKKKTSTKIPADLTGKTREYYIQAIKGDDKAQLMLAHSYQEGEGAPKDMSKAIHWYTKAAQQGNVIAQYNLGDIYDSGNGVNQDFAKAPIKATPWLNVA